MNRFTPLRAGTEVSKARSWVLPVFALALFTGAFLLFWIQPLFAKMVMPRLGGSPAVWNTCMVFFQTALSVGYAYAYGIVRWLTPTGQRLVHVGVLLAGGTFLPIAVASVGGSAAASMPVGWLLAVSTASIAVPFVAVAATAPLLQAWFARTGHAHAADPYFLYGASNLGSVGALVAFPFLLERLLTNPHQTWAWSATYAFLVLLIGVCGLVTVRGDVPADERPVADDGAGISWRRHLAWIVYAAIPSSLLIGVTNHITTDIAATPLLWVVPLALYLLSFILVFSRRPLLEVGHPVRLAPFAVVIVAAIMMIEARLGMSLPAGVELALHLSVFLVICLMSHGLLYDRRPSAGHLTRFYLFISLGGMVGGMGTALLAPMVFDGVYEYPLALAAACLLMPAAGGLIRRRDAIGVAIILVVMVGFDRLVPPADDEAMRKIVALVLLIPAIAIALAVRARPLAFALCIGAILVGAVLGNRQADTLWRGRSFFGAYRVGDTAEGLRLLYHGTTVHGAQWTDRFRSRRPATYYAEDSPVAGMIGRYRNTIGLDRVGVVGLGVGSLACYRAAGERWRFYEIDPLMVWIAARSGLFSFLQECPLDDPVVVGDGRLSLSNEKGPRFDLLIVDAFTSDAIPIHLLTREAFGVYLDRLGPEGVLVLHVSNRHVDLPPVIARLSAEMGLTARLARKTSGGSGFASLASDWIVIARRPETLERLRLGGMWSPLVADDDGRVWTDDYSNIIETIIWW